MKEIADTGLLVSVQQGFNKCSNLAVFDVSRKGQARKIYSFEEVSGGSSIVKVHHIIFIIVTGEGDVTYNPRRSILGAIPVGGKISYHLYNIATSKAGNIVKLIQKSRWHSHYNTGHSI